MGFRMRLALVLAGLALLAIACGPAATALTGSPTADGAPVSAPGTTAPVGLAGAAASATPAAAPALATPAPATPSTDDASGAAEGLDSLQAQFIDVYARVNPAVVYIETDSGSGSGFVVDAGGHIVTNNHVVAGASRVEVVFADGTRAAGRVLGRDPDADLAVIAVDVPAGGLAVAELGDSSSVQVGQFALAIGNPYGLHNTLTIGIVSGLGRTLQSERVAQGGQASYSNPDLIQTDAAINPGNSGGPLLDLQGRVIGVNAAIRTDTTVSGQPANSGVGFAIPINTVKRLLPSLIAGERYAYPYLGLSGYDALTLALQERLGLAQATGVYVLEVVPGGPADQAGLQAAQTQGSGLGPGGDLIVAIDGQPVSNFAGLIGYLVSYASPGDQVVLHVLRGTQALDLTVTLGERP
jgi:2-alkenal reductase